MAATASDSPGNKWHHPPSFYCPISQQCMHDPVVLSDGHTYERRHIERWLEHHSTSPVTGVQLQQKVLFPNHALRNAIDEYFQQIFSVHRRAIRKTIHGPDASQSLGSNAALLRTIDALMHSSMLMNADLNTECILRQIMHEAKILVGAEVASVFLVDDRSQELYSNVNSTGGELRIPISAGIAGHVATSGELVVIRDAYNDERFNKAVDVKTGFKTRNMICAPLMKTGSVLGVVQLINKTSTGLLATDKHGLDCFGTCAADFTADDVQFLQVFAAQAATAISNSGAFEPLQRKGSDRPISHQLSDGSCTNLMTSCFGGLLGKKERHKGLYHPCITEKGEIDDASFSVSGPNKPCPVEVLIAGPGRVHDLLAAGFSSWQLNTLELAEATGNRPLSSLAVYLFEKLGLVDYFGLRRQQLVYFFTLIEQGYDDAVVYHNRSHAASVLHAMHALLLNTGLAKVAAGALNSDMKGPSPDENGQLECMACLFAAAIHDYEHLGLSNDFLIKTADERAVRYNDQHVNEHHHLAAAFGVLYRPECNFLAGLPPAVFRRFRSLVVDIVLGTDMASGGKLVSAFTDALDTFGSRPKLGTETTETTSAASGYSSISAFIPASPREAVLLLQIAMKCADLGHLALPWDLHVLWVRHLEQEMFSQGDKEKDLGLPISFLMDRDKPGASETQVGFFDFVVLPLFRALVRALSAADPLLQAVEGNYQKWKEPSALPKRELEKQPVKVTERQFDRVKGECDLEQDDQPPMVQRRSSRARLHAGVLE